MLDIDLQHDLPFLNAAEVAGGKLSVEKVAAVGFEADQLLFNGVPVPGMTDVSVDIQAVVPRPSLWPRTWSLSPWPGAATAVRRFGLSS